ncbi:MAG: L-aspartate oxidase [Cyanobacteria bacterium Co-bin8]|nr:L-aspartate oxidase [Cyanobacteria bacterium Co-bin8]
MDVGTATTQFDVLVVGGGAAGLYTALCISQQLRVALITKDTLSVSASDWAQGGIAAAMAPNDSAQLHVADTLRAGAGLCEPAAVTYLAEQAAECIQHLVKLGVAFDRQGTDLAMTLEAAHSRHRVLHAADTTGRAIVSILAERVLERSNIAVFEQGFVLDLWQTNEGCQGVVLAHNEHILWISAQATVLATGGGGQVYAQTTNPPASTGDGTAMAWRAGALVRDLEFVQFHPTALAVSGAPPFLISEAVRGEGAHLIDHSGYRFAGAYHPDGELAPRDVVSRAIFQHLQKTGKPVVWLDMRPIEVDRLKYRFPNILKVCQIWGIDPLQQPVPVSPAAHYWMGGIVTDVDSRTSLPNLYAVGENASTGVHGANRLASNSLLECLVYGAQLRHLPIQPRVPAAVPAAIRLPELDAVLAQMRSQVDSWQQQRQALVELIWQSAGICREQNRLMAAIAQVQTWREAWHQAPLAQALQNLPPGQPLLLADPEMDSLLRIWGELTNLFDIAWLILQSAAFRTESRGGHFRNDYPQTSPDWQAHTLVQGDQWSLSEPVA